MIRDMNGWVVDTMEGVIHQYGVPGEYDNDEKIHGICASLYISNVHT